MTQLIQLSDNDRERKLARLHNYHSRYEIILTNSEDTYLVAYASHRSWRTAMTTAQNRFDQIKAIIGDTDAYVEGRKNAPIPADAKWRIRFTGRTQRECYNAGEWPFIGAVIAAQGVEEMMR